MEQYAVNWKIIIVKELMSYDTRHFKKEAPVEINISSKST
jgi:hypothetical protein